MTPFLMASLSSALLGWLMGFLSIFLILLILIQRGRGGGLTGALGGPGGQSAFGSKAGDTFTVITVVVAAIWGFSCAFTMWLLGTHAPSTTAERSTVTAGPGDDEEFDPSDRLIPTEEGLGGLIGDGPGETEDIELTPADAADEQTDGEELQAPDAGNGAQPPTDEASETAGAEAAGSGEDAPDNAEVDASAAERENAPE